jgi:hypothetical protein
VAEGEEHVDDALPNDGLTEDDAEGWPLLSDLELDVCVSESGVPGVESLADRPQRA